MKTKLFLSLTLFASLAASPVMAGGLKNLPPSKTPRIKVTDRVWAKTPGDASVCIWKDDKIFPVTITVDDNCAPDHPWWLEMAEKYNFKVTWFVIVARVSDNPRNHFGTWAHFKKLLDAGHDVQSHSYSHLNDDKLTIEQEYADSVTAIEKNLPGHKVLALAYPGGKKSKKNSVEEAAKHFIGCRGTRGVTNSVAATNYLETCSLSGRIPLNAAECRWANVEDCMDPKSRNFRNWMSIHYHGVSKPEDRAKAEKAFQRLKELEKDIWLGSFVQALKYGQERDTAELKVTKNTPAEIVFSLTDKMDDALFDYPLTVKVCVPSDWAAIEVVQKDKPAAFKTVEKDGAKYVLVQAVPDAGDVVIRKK